MIEFKEVIFQSKFKIHIVKLMLSDLTVILLTIEAIALKAVCPMFNTRPKTTEHSYKV